MHSKLKRLLKRIVIAIAAVVALYVVWGIWIWISAERMYMVGLPSSGEMNEEIALDTSRQALLLAGKDVTGLTPLPAKPAKGTNAFVRIGTNSGFVNWMGWNRIFSVAMTVHGSNAACVITGSEHER